MHDAGTMDIGERLCQHHTDFQSILDGQRRLRKPALERPTGEILLNEKRYALPHFDAVDDREMRMCDCGHRPGLAAQPGHFARCHARQCLDGHLSTEIEIERAIDDTHPAGTDALFETED